MIQKVLIANRGEIAVRVMRSCKEMGIRTVAVFSEADRTARHVMYADEACLIGPAASKDSYLNIDNIIKAAKQHHADAIHPGYGFLSENADFARRCKEEGIIFIGPAAETMEAMGDKIAARKRMIAAGVPVVPGTEQPLQSAEEAVRICNEIGYPVMLKASMGGGGKGMRLIHNENEVVEAYNTARSEASVRMPRPVFQPPVWVVLALPDEPDMAFELLMLPESLLPLRQPDSSSAAATAQLRRAFCLCVISVTLPFISLGVV